MKLEQQDITLTKLDRNASMPYELLLLADPSKELVDSYLHQSQIFIASKKEEVLGVIVLLPLSDEIIEIKNIAVKPPFQKLGIGSFLIENAIQVATGGEYKSICIGTANSSIGQIYLYQKLGFELSEIKNNFFISNYPDPIYENGIQAKHMLVFTKIL